MHVDKKISDSENLNNMRYLSMELRENNLFKYATSELSQDAFICWLLSHATKECWNVDSDIRSCALDFVKEILGSKFVDFKDNLYIKNIEKQYKNIDVLFQVDKYFVIIEDKTFTGTHDDQVNRYKKTLIDEGIEEDNIICVYYKIDIQPEPEKDVDIEFTREGILKLFKPYKDKIKNSIFQDYIEYLEFLEWESNAYERLPITEWNSNAYKGFFKKLGKTILKDEHKSWGYVANPTGGFMGLWWFDILADRDYIKIGYEKEYLSELYLQIEDNVIAVKYTIDKQDFTDMNTVSAIRWNLYNYFHNEIGDSFMKKSFRPGKYMTIGYIEYTEKNYKDTFKMMKRLLQELPNKINKIR